MNRIVILGALVALAFAVPGCYKESEPPPQGEKGDIMLRDLSGEGVTLSDFRGKVVLMEFWATWCPPCRKSFPELNELHEHLKDEAFVLLAVAVKDTKSKVKRFVSDNGVAFRVVMDTGGFADEYKAFSIPTTVILDKEGKVVLNHRGYAPGMFKEIEKEIRRLL